MTSRIGALDRWMLASTEPVVHVQVQASSWRATSPPSRTFKVLRSSARIAKARLSAIALVAMSPCPWRRPPAAEAERAVVEHHHELQRRARLHVGLVVGFGAAGHVGVMLRLGLISTTLPAFRAGRASCSTADGQIGSDELALQCLPPQRELRSISSIRPIRETWLSIRVWAAGEAAGIGIGGDRRGQVAEGAGHGARAAEQVLDAGGVAIDRCVERGLVELELTGPGEAEADLRDGREHAGHGAFGVEDGASCERRSRTSGIAADAGRVLLLGRQLLVVMNETTSL